MALESVLKIIDEVKDIGAEKGGRRDFIKMLESDRKKSAAMKKLREAVKTELNVNAKYININDWEDWKSQAKIVTALKNAGLTTEQMAVILDYSIPETEHFLDAPEILKKYYGNYYYTLRADGNYIGLHCDDYNEIMQAAREYKNNNPNAEVFVVMMNGEEVRDEEEICGREPIKFVASFESISCAKLSMACGRKFKSYTVYNENTAPGVLMPPVDLFTGSGKECDAWIRENCVETEYGVQLKGKENSYWMIGVYHNVEDK